MMSAPICTMGVHLLGENPNFLGLRPFKTHYVPQAFTLSASISYFELYFETLTHLSRDWPLYVFWRVYVVHFEEEESLYMSID